MAACSPPPPTCAPAGGIFSQTAHLLSPELTTIFPQTHQRFDEKSGYGCGLYKRLDDSLFSVVGGDAGVGFNSRYFVGQQISISLLSHITNGEEDLREVVMAFFDKKS